MEKKYDKQLHIRTVGLREWRNNDAKKYNRYEATPYEALEVLLNSYKAPENSKLVDFGSGRGRVAFFFHDKLHIPVTGIEANDKTFEEALKNKMTYRRKRSHINAPITFEYALAEQYEIQHDDNLFYFFNPFSVQIFKRVVNNIIHSLKEQERMADIILYYPLPDFVHLLKRHTPFKKINKVRVKGVHGKYGKFSIFRYS
ncbi:MAG TPA: SAM-dependent methyltransferase [Pseudogracilibacillus sp.]|nr:SAM-dependent methyltransferase [Pseudogracilibacillus sp.]